VRHWWDRFARGRSQIIPPVSPPPSLFELIEQALREKPESPLDDPKFPKISPIGELDFAAGALDGIGLRFNEPPGDDETHLSKLFESIRRGKVSNWQVLDENIRGRSCQRGVQNVLSNMQGKPVSGLNPELFRHLALNSRDYEAVKWGIVIGAMDGSTPFKENLFVFARHAEFTLYAVNALLSHYPNTAEIKQNLFSLLAVADGWGTIRLVELILTDARLRSDRSVQRECLVHGMDRCGGIPMEVAFTIASNIDINHFISLSEADKQVFNNLSLLMISLATEPNPLGGLRDLPNGEAIFDGYFELLNRIEPDIYVLAGLQALQDFVNEDETTWAGKRSLSPQIRNLIDERATSEVLRAGLAETSMRWVALKSIREKRLKDLVPDVERLFLDTHDATSIEVLGELGESRELEILFREIPKLVNLSEREARPLSQVFGMGPEHKNTYEYAAIIKSLARLGTAEAIVALKRAFRDYDPLVRAAACDAVRNLDRSKLDLEITDLIQERLSEKLQFVVDAARKTALWIGMSDPGQAPTKPS
jgi:hypothetical protein